MSLFLLFLYTDCRQERWHCCNHFDDVYIPSKRGGETCVWETGCTNPISILRRCLLYYTFAFFSFFIRTEKPYCEWILFCRKCNSNHYALAPFHLKYLINSDYNRQSARSDLCNHFLFCHNDTEALFQMDIHKSSSHFHFNLLYCVILKSVRPFWVVSLKCGYFLR